MALIKMNKKLRDIRDGKPDAGDCENDATDEKDIHLEMNNVVIVMVVNVYVLIIKCRAIRGVIRVILILIVQESTLKPKNLKLKVVVVTRVKVFLKIVAKILSTKYY